MHRLSEDNETTLKVIDQLGLSRWQQGRFKEASELHQRALHGLEKFRGSAHADTLRAKMNLGRTLGKLFKFDEAVELHTEASDGLKKVDCLGPTHLDTLIVLDNLAMAHFDRYCWGNGNREDPIRSYQLEVDVVDQRKKKLWKEHPYTLWSICNFARIRLAMGFVEEAEDLIRSALSVARRNLGESHNGDSVRYGLSWTDSYFWGETFKKLRSCLMLSIPMKSRIDAIRNNLLL